MKRTPIWRAEMRVRAVNDGTRTGTIVRLFKHRQQGNTFLVVRWDGEHADCVYCSDAGVIEPARNQ